MVGVGGSEFNTLVSNLAANFNSCRKGHVVFLAITDVCKQKYC